MKTMKLLLLCIFALFLSKAALSKGQENSNPVEQEIRDCLQSIKESAEKLDTDLLYSLILENDKGVLVEDGRILLTRTQALNSTKEGFRGVKKATYEFDEEHITMLSSELALVVSGGESHFELHDGRRFDVRFAQSVILKRVEGRWKMLHAHRSIPSRR